MAGANVLNIDSDNFDQEVIKSEIPVLVDFWAQWCGPCRMIAPVVDELADDYQGKLKVCKVNVDEQSSLASKFRVVSIPTLLLIKGGSTADRIIGLRSREELDSAIQKIL